MVTTQSLILDKYVPKASVWGRKRRRCYGRFCSGIQFARAHNEDLYFLTLTSSGESDVSKISQHFRTLVKRIRRVHSFEYCKIRTREGINGGVIHCLYKVKDVCLWVPALRKAWLDIHSAHILKIVKTYGKLSRLASYLVGYLGKHADFRLSWSYNWIFVGWLRKMREFILRWGFYKGLKAWKEFLIGYTKRVLSKQIDLFGRDVP